MRVHEDVLRRVASRLHRLEPGCKAGSCCWLPDGCDEITVYIDPFSIVEEAHVAQELLRLRELAEQMAKGLELVTHKLALISHPDTRWEGVGMKTLREIRDEYRKEYPNG